MEVASAFAPFPFLSQRFSADRRGELSMAHVFISYSSKQLAMVELLKSYLKSKGLSVWHDLEALEARGPFKGQIVAGLQQAGAVVVIWTTDAIVSEWVNFEAEYADKNRKLINVEPSGINRTMLPKKFQEHHRHVQSSSRPLDLESVYHDILAVREGRPLPREVALRQLYEDKYDELLLDAKRLPIPPGYSETPSVLLQAKYGLVDFIDFRRQRSILVTWAQGLCGSSGRPAAAGRLIHGAGGVGKTRLMIEVTAALREQGWSAGFLNRVEATVRQPDKPKLCAEALVQLVVHGSDKGLAIVIDYAEGRTEDVRSLSRQLIEAGKMRPDRPLILFLLTREIGEWWDNLRRDDPTGGGQAVAALFSAGLGHTAELAIQQGLSLEHRWALFNAARQRFSERLAATIKVNTADPSPQLAARLVRDPDYDRPLALLMEALLHVYSRSLAGDAIGMAALLDGILDLEFGHWRKVISGLENTRELQRAAAQVTLVGGVPNRAEAASLLMTDPYYAALRTAPASAQQAIAALSRLYGDGCGALSGLEPDLLGEHLILTEIAWDNQQGFDLVYACLGWDSRAPIRWRQVLNVLNRATRPDHGAKTAHAEALLARVIEQFGEDLSSYLIDESVQTPSGTLADIITKLLPISKDREFAALMLWIPEKTDRLAAASLARVRIQQASLQSTLERMQGKALSESDREILLLSAITKATEGNQLSQIGAFEDALNVTRDALTIIRQLDDALPGFYDLELANTLTNLGNHLDALKRHEESMPLKEEAVRIYEDVSASLPASGLEPLAMCLNNLASCYLGAGLPIKAEACARRSVSINQMFLTPEGNQLAMESQVIGRQVNRPEIDFEFNLSVSLHTLGMALSALALHDEALIASEKSVTIRRNLAARNPDTYLRELAHGLFAQSAMFAANNDFRAAAEAAADGLKEIYPLLEHGMPYIIGLAQNLGRNYMDFCNKADIRPRHDLLKTVALMIGRRLQQ
jgi:tetratricopeptide (TPR) repeat protein